MKKRLLILCSVLVLVVALASPAFATEVNSLSNTIWSIKDNGYLNGFSGKFGTFNLYVTAYNTKFSSITFSKSKDEASNDVWCVLLDDQVVYTRSRDVGASFYHNSVYNSFKDLTITGGTDAQNSDLIHLLNQVYSFEGEYTPPVYNSVPDAVTGDLPGYLEIIGSILTALFTPTGDLFQLGVVIAVCFGGAVIYGGVRLFRKLTPGV